MDEMTAFERQMAGGLHHMGGAGRRIDPMAMTLTAATQSPKWRVQTMFSATKFLVAGAIVALFGGFLLSGVLTQQPSDEPLPPAAASASASPEADATATPEQPERSDILPGVDLVTEEVEPGVYRVLGDGVRDLSGQVQDVAVSAEGDIWVEAGSRRNWSVFRLGAPGVSPKLGRKFPWRLGLTADDMPMVTNDGVAKVLGDGRWAGTELGEYDLCLLGKGPNAIGDDGGCWTSIFGDGDDEAVSERIDGDGTRTGFTRAEIGLEPDQWVGPFFAASDGVIWGVVASQGERFANFDGVVAYHGSAWSLIPYDGDDLEIYAPPFAVDADGVVWVAGLLEDRNAILTWDGESWTPHPEIDYAGRLLPWANGMLVVSSDGTRWFGPAMSTVDLSIPKAHGPFAIAPDGTAWTIRGKRLYVITPEAVAANE